MKKTKEELWERFKQYYFEGLDSQFALDISRIDFPDDFFSTMESRMQAAYQAMAELEKGSLANPDEGRMVGHYWLRNPELAPTNEIREQIQKNIVEIKAFAASVHDGSIASPAGPFENILLIGIGGSALGPQFISHALGDPCKDKLKFFVLDNTDPDGMDRVLASLASTLGKTLVIVISKSGRTKETRNGMLEVEAAFKHAGLSFPSNAIAVSAQGSELDLYATQNGWLRRFPMWDWVGGRTSATSAVGLLPAALQGFDIEELLSGARTMDSLTREAVTRLNPAALLSLSWFQAGNGKGTRDMVIIPYKDRLELLSRYLQQLVMESLGKELDVQGRRVNQGIAVYGNKGSTDQHAYIQQLRDGLDNFFVTFIAVRRERSSNFLLVEPTATCGDYLHGFLLGTREALYTKRRQSISITIGEVSAFLVGALIALFERAVGFYASLVNVNAYHQPGVEAGKKAAEDLLTLQREILNFLGEKRGSSSNVEQISTALGVQDSESVFHLCEHLAFNPERKVRRIQDSSPFNRSYMAT